MPGLTSSLPAGWRPPARVLVSKLGHIGDVLVITPFCKALKDIFPGARISALVNQGTEEMAEGCPSVDEVLLVERQARSWGARLKANLRLISALRREPFDMSFELSAGDRGSYLCRIAGAGLRVGFDSGCGHVRDRLFHVLLPRYQPGCHEVENFLRQLEIFQIPFSPPPLQWLPNSPAVRRAGEILAEAGFERYVLAHPTSRWMFKAWTPEKNAQVINRLNDGGWPVVLTSGPDGREMAYMEEVSRCLTRREMVLNLAGSLSLSQLGALIARASLFFGVDSAPMHLAAALNRPTVALFGPSGEHMWGPWRTRHQVLSGVCSIRPCGRDGCNGSKVCLALRDLPAGPVYEAITRLLAEV